MRNGKYAQKPAYSAKPIVLLLAVTLLVGCVTGGTLAWLISKPAAVTNTFTTSEVNIELTETKGTEKDGNREFKMVPGYTIEKDPKVTVKAGSEDCFVFVKVVKQNNPDAYLTYTIDSGWTQLKDDNGTPVDGVYHRKVAASATDQSFVVLTGNQVTVKDTVTNANMTTAKTSIPSLTFTAYAIQSHNSNNTEFGVYEAWTTISAN